MISEASWLFRSVRENDAEMVYSELLSFESDFESKNLHRYLFSDSTVRFLRQCMLIGIHHTNVCELSDLHSVEATKHQSLLQVEANDPGAAKLAERLSDLSAQCDDDGGSSQYDDQNGSLF